MKLKKIVGGIILLSLLSSFQLIALGAESAMGVICAPVGIMMDADGSCLVADSYNNVIWRVSGDGSAVYAGTEGVRGLYGESAGGYRDGPAAQALFEEPWAIAPYLDGYAVTDSGNHVIRLIDAAGVRTAVGSGNPGFADGNGRRASFNRPTGLAADQAGNLYIADTDNQCIRMVTPSGVVSTYIKGLSAPSGLCYKNGVLYIADAGSHQILAAREGRCQVLAGTGGEGMGDGPAAQALFSSPQGIAVDNEGIIYISDTGNRAVRRLKDGVVTTVVAGNPDNLEAAPVSPVGLLLSGNTLYICDRFANMVLTVDVMTGGEG